MGDQGFDDQFNDGLFVTSLHTSIRQRPRMWPKSVSEMRGHTDYGNQGMNDWDTAHSDFMARRPYYQQAQFYKPFWHDLSHPRNQRVWHGFHGHQYYDPSYGGWRWIDSGAR